MANSHISILRLTFQVYHDILPHMKGSIDDSFWSIMGDHEKEECNSVQIDQRVSYQRRSVVEAACKRQRKHTYSEHALRDFKLWHKGHCLLYTGSTKYFEHRRIVRKLNNCIFYSSPICSQWCRIFGFTTADSDSGNTFVICTEAFSADFR